MIWRSFMFDPRKCCICRHRIYVPWVRPATYLGMICHQRCKTRQNRWLDEQAPFRVVNR